MAVDVTTLTLARGYAKSKVNDMLAISPFVYKGAVANYAELPSSAAKGDMYTTIDNGYQYLWSGAEWIKFGNEVTKEMLDGKQDKLSDEDKQSIADLHKDAVNSVNLKSGDVILDGSNINYDESAGTKKTIRTVIEEIISKFTEYQKKLKAGTNVTISDDNVISSANYTAGKNVQISSDYVVSATDTQYTAGENVKISEDNKISAIDTKYKAGTHITISEDNVISSSGEKYTAGDNIQISSDNKISATDTKYTAGTNITISADNVISATGGGGGSVTPITDEEIDELFKSSTLDSFILDSGVLE